MCRVHNIRKFDPSFFPDTDLLRGRFSTWQPILTGYSYDSREFVINGKVEIRVLETDSKNYHAMLDRLQKKLLRFKKYNNRRVFESWVTNNSKKAVIFT